MKPIASAVARFLFILFSIYIVVPAVADETPLPNKFALTVKTGSLELQEDRQTINNYEWDFKRGHSVFAVEGEGWIDSEKHHTVGGELLRFSSGFSRVDDPSFSHRLQFASMSVKSKYFFGSANSVWRPYVGGGIGMAYVTDSEGPIGGDAGGMVFQGIAGVQVRAERIGVRAEYVYLHADIDDEHDSSVVNASAHMILIGVSFYFGSAR